MFFCNIRLQGVPVIERDDRCLFCIYNLYSKSVRAVSQANFIRLFSLFLDDTKYLKQPYTALEFPDLEIYHVTADTYCRTHCSGNSSCAAYSYNISTQTCYLSGEPIVRDDKLQQFKLAFVKKRFFPELQVLEVVHTVYQGMLAPYYIGREFKVLDTN